MPTIKPPIQTTTEPKVETTTTVVTTTFHYEEDPSLPPSIFEIHGSIDADKPFVTELEDKSSNDFQNLELQLKSALSNQLTMIDIRTFEILNVQPFATSTETSIGVLRRKRQLDHTLVDFSVDSVATRLSYENFTSIFKLAVIDSNKKLLEDGLEIITDDLTIEEKIEETSKKLSTGVIIGIVIGVIIVLVLVLAIVKNYFCKRKREIYEVSEERGELPPRETMAIPRANSENLDGKTDL